MPARTASAARVVAIACATGLSLLLRMLVAAGVDRRRLPLEAGE